MKLIWANKVDLIEEAINQIFSDVSYYERCSTQLVWVFFAGKITKSVSSFHSGPQPHLVKWKHDWKTFSLKALENDFETDF